MTDIETEPGQMTLAEIVADISAAAYGAATPDELAERLKHFYADSGENIRHFRVMVLAASMSVIQGAIESGGDMECAHRIVAQELECAAAIVVRSLYKKLDKPFSPGRFAIVAHQNAVYAEKLFTTEIERAADAFIDEATNTSKDDASAAEEALRA